MGLKWMEADPDTAYALAGTGEVLPYFPLLGWTCSNAGFYRHFNGTRTAAAIMLGLSCPRTSLVGRTE